MPKIDYVMDSPSYNAIIEVIDGTLVYRDPLPLNMSYSYPVLDNLLKRAFEDGDPKRALSRRAILNMGWEYIFGYDIDEKVIVATLFKLTPRQLKRVRGIGEKCFNLLYGFLHSEMGERFKKEYNLEAGKIDLYSNMILRKFRK